MLRTLTAPVLAAPLALAGCGSSHDTAAAQPAAAVAQERGAASTRDAMPGMHDDGMHDGMAVPDVATVPAGVHDDGMGDSMSAPDSKATAATAGTGDDGMGDGMDDGMAVADAKPAQVADSLSFTAQTTDGKTFSGASLAGHGAVLWFWAPGCADCVKLAPAVPAAEKAHPGVHFIGIAGLSDATAALA
jgi:hypothetical protein